jgi:cytochrome c556
MPRKWMTLAAGLAAVVLTLSGLSVADDDDSPLHKLMEKVAAKNNAISKGTRTAVAYKKAQKELPQLAEDLIQYGKEARKDTETAKKQKKSQAEWEKLMDDYLAKTEEFKSVVSKANASQAAAKSAHGVVKQTCTNCHNVFKVEEDDK